MIDSVHFFYSNGAPWRADSSASPLWATQKVVVVALEMLLVTGAIIAPFLIGHQYVFILSATAGGVVGVYELGSILKIVVSHFTSYPTSKEPLTLDTGDGALSDSLITDGSLSKIPSIFQEDLDAVTFDYFSEGDMRIVYKAKELDWVMKAKQWKGLPMLVQRSHHFEVNLFQLAQFLGFATHVPPTYNLENKPKNCTAPIPSNSPLLLQHFVGKDHKEMQGDQLEVDHAHKALLFHWIIGRSDARRPNSVVTAEGIIWEVDNEFWGRDLHYESNGGKYVGPSKHWLQEMAEIYESEISKETIEFILALTEDLSELELEYKPPDDELNHVASNIVRVKEAICILQKNEEPITPKAILEQIKASYKMKD